MLVVSRSYRSDLEFIVVKIAEDELVKPDATCQE